MRQLILSPRWIVWHVLTLGAVITCGWLAAWQWERAGSAMGSALNIGYGLQWPFFAVFFAVMWWRLLRMEAAKLAETEGAAEPGPGESAEPEPTAPVAVDRPTGSTRSPTTRTPNWPSTTGCSPGWPPGTPTAERRTP